MVVLVLCLLVGGFGWFCCVCFFPFVVAIGFGFWFGFLFCVLRYSCLVLCYCGFRFDLIFCCFADFWIRSLDFAAVCLFLIVLNYVRFGLCGFGLILLVVGFVWVACFVGLLFMCACATGFKFGLVGLLCFVIVWWLYCISVCGLCLLCDFCGLCG